MPTLGVADCIPLPAGAAEVLSEPFLPLVRRRTAGGGPATDEESPVASAAAALRLEAADAGGFAFDATAAEVDWMFLYSDCICS